MTVVFDLASVTNSSCIPEPIVAIAFLIPNFSKFLTSFRPSTIIIALLSETFGPAVIPEISFSVSKVSTERTSSNIFLDSSWPEFTMFNNNALARSITFSRFADLIFSIALTLITALHGPIRSIVSNAAPMTAVLT